MKKDIITRVYIADDWEAYYLNDNLIAEGHTVSTMDVLDALDINYQYKTVIIEDIDKFDTPSKLSKLKLK